MRKCFAIIAAIGLLTACGGGNGENAKTENLEPWKLEFNHLKRTEDDCKNEPCTYIELSIPVLKGGSVEVSSMINEYIDGRFRESLKSRLPEPNSTAPYGDLADSFLEGYKLFNMEFPDNDASWFVELKGDSSVLADDYFTAILSEYDYMGGAHPNGYTTIQSFDLSSGEIINVFEKYDSLALVTQAETAFRIIHSVPDSLSLNDAGMMF